MTTSVRGGLVGLALISALTMAACNDPAPAPATTTSPTTGTTSSTSSSSSTTQSDPQVASAEAVVQKFWGVVNSLGTDPTKSLDELTTVARGQTLETWRELLTQRRRQGHRQVGSISMVSSTASTAPDHKLKVDACVDVSKTDLVDKDGTSAVSKDRSARVRYAYVVEQAKDGKFYVLQDKVVGTC